MSETPLDSPPPSRRNLLGWLVGIINVVVVGAVAGPVLGFVTSPLRKKARKQWVPILPLGDLEMGETREVKFAVLVKDGYAAKEHHYSVYLRRYPEKIIAFDPACTHLGCRIHFQGDKKRYLCPCHGGVFDDEGRVVSGPPPKALEQHPVKVQDGQILVSWRT